MLASVTQNMPVSVAQRPLSNQRVSRRVAFYLAAFLVPALTVAVCFWIKGMAPFGNAFVTGWDCYTQYVEYFDWYRRVLTGGAGLFYSFGKSLGGNMTGLFSYYLASPLNLLIVFFPEGTTLAFMDVLVIIKVGLCGLTCGIYLSKRFNLHPTLVLALATGYALCDYVATFSICGIMWMEGLIWLPLVMLGIYRWITQKRKALFLVASVGTVFCCWFTAYMTFIYMILYFIYEYLLLNGRVPVKRFLKDLLIFGVLMIAGVLLSLFILLPTAFAQMQGEPGDFVVGFWRMFYLSDLPAALFIGRENIANAPQICCGTLALFGIFLFFFNRRIARSEKIIMLAMLFVMLASCLIMLGVEVWDGMRVTRGYYCRFAFLLCFLMICIAARGLEQMEKPPLWQIAVFAGILLALVVWEVFQTNNFINDAYLYTAVGAIILTAFMIRILPSRPAIAGILLATICAAELGFNFYGTVGILAKDDTPAASYEAYRLAESAKLNAIEASDPSFFRLEKTYSRLNLDFSKMRPPASEGLAQGYSQIGGYSSSNDQDLTLFLYRMGYCRPDMGSTDFKESIPVSDALLGVKYVLDVDGTVTVNEDALPIGYAASDSVLGSLPLYETQSCSGYAEKADIANNIYVETQDPFAQQNAFISMILGEDVECFKPVAVTQTTDTATCKEWTVDSAGHSRVYAYIDSDHLAYATLSVGARSLGEYNYWSSYYVFDVSDLSTGETVKLVPETAANVQKLDDQTLIAYYLDEDVFNAAMDKLKASAFTPDTVADGFVHGTYSTDADTLLFTTIPYDEGWTVTVDGVKVDTEKAVDTFLAFPVEAGTHEITMTYLPKGLVPGIAISVGTLAILIAIWLVRRKKRPDAAASAPTDPDADVRLKETAPQKSA